MVLSQQLANNLIGCLPLIGGLNVSELIAFCDTLTRANALRNPFVN